MKLIESRAEYIPQSPGLNGIYEQIELAGRTAYHSQDKITAGSAMEFVDRMIKSRHYAALEHGTVYLNTYFTWDSDFYASNPYSVRTCPDTLYYITTNLRVLLENNRLEDLDKEHWFCDGPCKEHEKRYTFRFTCSRAIAQELTRHRTFSFLMESQRYCGYDKGKFNGETTFIAPSWLGKLCSAGISNPETGYSDMFTLNDYYNQLQDAENAYMTARTAGLQPQEARDILPNAVKTELIMTGFASDWRYLLDLRLFEKTGKVHPDMKDLMGKTRNAMEEAGIWEDIINHTSKFNNQTT